MKLQILYRPNSEHSRIVEEFIHNFKDKYGAIQVEILSLDTREGSSLASLYDIVQYPAMMVIQNDGTPQKIWQGEFLPLMDEVASYARI